MDGILLLGQKSCIEDINFKFIWCQNPYQLPKLLHFRGTKTHTGKLFGIKIFFYLKSQDHIGITRTKISLVSHLLHT